MASLNCFCSSSWKKKKDKNGVVTSADKDNNAKTLHVKLENVDKSSETTELRSTSFVVPVPFEVPGSSSCVVKVINDGSPVEVSSGEVDYEGGDEHDSESFSMKRDNSDFDLQACVQNLHVENHQTVERMNLSSPLDDDGNNNIFDDMRNRCSGEGVEFITSGHASDPGRDKDNFWASPELKRSCSSMALGNNSHEFSELLPPSKSKSYVEIQKLNEMDTEEIMNPTSPISVMTHRSADKVMLKKHSSSQILPSRSRKLWWKLFLWSHRNLHKAGTAKPQPIVNKPFGLNQQGGYCSDTLEPKELNNLKSPGSLTGESMDKGKGKMDERSWDGFYGVSGMWPQNQWIAFPSASSPLTRVDEWVTEVSAQPPYLIDVDDHDEDGIIFPPSPDNGASPGKAAPHLTRDLPEEISHANSVIQSLNASSTVAHIIGMGLKVLPSISHFASLRSINLSGNSIAHITPGSLPKGLHALDLSRNKISTIEGLRELTRLRVLDLSYNRISRIGQGLSNCTVIKELYLAGNKISDVEGMHRLLKLTVLDLSFNKITTAKALGQLVANYNSLIAVNLLGNPIQSNISDDQLRKTMCSLLPKLAFLNKQPINPQKAREIHKNAIAKAALGDNSRNSRRKTVKRVSQGSSSSPSAWKTSSSTVGAEKSRLKSRSHSRHH